ncbi:MAG TPA: hypothetical protein VF950_09175 [Planctomycetota bacterium]
MARISLKCGCGWNFFVPGTVQGHETPCPNCGDAVNIPGRKASEGGPKSPGVIAAEKQAKQRQVVLLVSAAAAILLISVILLMVSGGSPPPVVEDEQRGPGVADKIGPKTSRTTAPAYKPPPDEPPATSDPKIPIGPNRESKINELRQGIKINIWRLNLAGITSESLRLRGHVDATGQLQERMKTWEAKIVESVAQLLELGDRFAVEPHILPGDRLVAFAQKPFATLQTSRIDLDLLSPWLRSFRAGMPLEQAVVLRGSEKIEFFLQFPEASEDLQGISRLPDITGPGQYVDGPVAAAGTAPLPKQVLIEIETRLKAIPAGYRNLLPLSEAQKLDQLLKTQMGTSEDNVFLQTRVLLEALPAFEREAALIRAKAGELELKIKETTSVDVVHFKDGRKVSGQVLENTATHVKLKARLGSMTIPQADIAKIETGKGPGLEFPGKLSACPRTPPELAKLLGWCQQNTLRLEAEYVAVLLLALDPLHDGARKAAGLSPRPAGKSSSAPPPPSSTAPFGAPPASGGDSVVRTMDLLAADVVKKSPSFADVVAQMRAASVGVAYASAAIAPPRSARAAALIQDPLTFSLTNLNSAAALEMGQWWGALAPDDRREFALFFGLWCAQKRGGR